MNAFDTSTPTLGDIDLFTSSVLAIKREYIKLNHSLGWRFLMSPRATLNPTADIGFISLNPGGNSIPADHPQESSEAGNAYLIESWCGYSTGSAPLQRQVQMLFTKLSGRLREKRTLREFLDTAVMSACFIPFRSRNVAALPRRQESLAFAKSLWTRILEGWTPRCILTIDAESFQALSKILISRAGAETTARHTFPTGWGDIQAEAIQVIGARKDSPVTIARLPHLSRFQLFGNAARAPKLDIFIDYLATQTGRAF